jgi:hypothetical protein
LSYLLDTNVVSELRKPSPNPAVADWFETVTSDELYISVLVVGEVRQGIERLRRRDPAQAAVFERWLAALKQSFADRVLPITTAVAEAWGRLNAPAPLPSIDGLLAATALVHDLTFVTREAERLRRSAVPLLNPWG